jgi:membrane protease YdiL (CAAX protease family)
MKKFILIFVICLSFNIRAQMANGFAGLIPGLGQVSNGNYWEALGYLTGIVGFSTQKDPKLKTVGLNIWFYSMYDAWRDAGGTPAEKDTPIFIHYAQNFNPLNVFDPIGASLIGVAASSRSEARQRYEEDAIKKNDQEYLHRWHNTDMWKSTLTFAAVGMGEEAFFRGFLFPGLSSFMGTWAGAITSSLMFGFAHVGNREENFGISLVGLIFCWQYHRNQYKLAKNIFAHSWFDQVLVGPFMIEGENYSWRKSPLGIRLTFTY